MATTSRRGNPGTPYTPGVDGGGTNPGHRGNPGTPYEPPYKKDEKPTTESRGTPYTPPGKTESPTPSQPSQPSEHSSTSHDEEQQQQNRNPFYNPGQQSTQQQQNQTNNNFINGLDDTSSVYGMDAEKVNNSVEIARQLPKTKLAAMNKRNASVRSELKKVQAELKAQQQNNATIRASDLESYANSTYWSNGRKQDVSYATSVQYYNMQRSGYELVYVEDGSGTLENKGGIFTIGRDNLAGLPSNVNTVLVDNNGNWKYLADTTSRADHVEALKRKLAAVNRIYDNEENTGLFQKELALRDTAYKRRSTLEGKIAAYERIANKTKAPEDIRRLQAAIDALAAYNNVVNDSQSRLESYGKEWAAKYEFYNHAITKNSKWTVEDEAVYQDLKSTIARGILMTPENVSQFSALNKRREANKDCAAFLSRDYVAQLKKQEEAMKKAVDDYNKWDSVTIHMEKGEDIGTQVKRLMAINLGYDPNANDDAITKGLKFIDAVRALRTGGISALPNIFKKEYWDRSKDTYKATGEAISKTFTPISVAYEEYKKSRDAYKSATERIDRILEKDNVIEQSDVALNNLRAKQNQYLQASENAVTQGRNILFNNVISNLSIFDIASVQSTFVAWRMAKHPERYWDDPKFQKMQSAYREIYGTNFKEDMDAGKMAMAMLQVKLGRDRDYIYLDGTDLKHRSGENYGLLSSLAVGLLTDVSALAGIGKGIIGLTTRKLGARVVAKSATESFTEALVRAKVSDDVAREFAESSGIQAAIRKDVNEALKKAMKDGGDDIANSIKTTLKRRAELLDDFAVDDFKLFIDKNQYDDFLRNAEELVSQSDNITHTALQIQKGTMLTHALGTLDDTLNDMQSILFKATCPAVGAVTGVARISKAIKEAHMLELADESSLHRLMQTTKQAYAKIEKLNFDSILNSVEFEKQWKEIMDEWSNGVMGSIKQLPGQDYTRLAAPFKDCSDFLLRETANSYVQHVIDQLDFALNTRIADLTGGGISIRNSFDELEKLAQEHGYNTFDEMHKVINENIKIMYDASPDAKYIVEAFNRRYEDAVLKRNIEHIKAYVKNTEDHVSFIKKVLGTKGSSVISSTNARMYPKFVEGTADAVLNNIKDFLKTVNNDYTTIIHNTGVAGTETVAAVHSIHETAAKAIEALEFVSLGDLSKNSIQQAQAWLYKYAYEMDNVYLNELRKWGQDTIQDAFGVQDYLKGINAAVPNHAGNTEILNNLADSMQKFFTEKGVNVSKEEILDKVLRQNGKDFLRLPSQQQASLVYRIMENKGHMITKEISDSNLKLLTDQLIDCNAQLNKNIRLLQMYFPPNSEAYNLIDSAISNACAVANTRMLNEYLKAGNIDGTMHNAILDVFAGSSNRINSIAQAYSPDIAATKIRDFVINEAKKQLSLHNGDYSKFTELGCNTVDVGANVLKLEEIIKNSEYSNLYTADPKCIDVCVSMIRSTDGAAPKDVAFHVLGSTDAPTVLRKDIRFTAYSDDFARNTYSRTAQQLTDEYAALGATDVLSTDEWIKQTQDYINTVKQKALEENKTIRFIGFNTSDAISGDNKYITEVLRSCGVNANTANAIDFADTIRASKDLYVFDPKDINTLDRALRMAVDESNAKSISLGIRNAIAYDPKHTCADMLGAALKDVEFDDAMFNAQANYILKNVDLINKSLGTEAYNELGLAMGAYIDATAFAKILDDAGISSVHTNGDLMKIITNATTNGEPQLSINKIIETAMDEEWLDYSKFTRSFTIQTVDTMEYIHDAVKQLNQINENIHRVDLLTDADRAGLTRIYKDFLYKSGSFYHNSRMYSIARAIKVDELTTQQLYAANKWLLNNIETFMEPEAYDRLIGKALVYAPEQTTKLLDVGYNFLCHNIVDYTNDSIDAFLVKYLDDSELGYQFAQSLNSINTFNNSVKNLKNYMDAVEGLYKKFDIHGVQDRLIVNQLAEVYMPIIRFQDNIKKKYLRAYGEAVKALKEEAVDRYGKRYSKAMVERIAVNNAVSSAKEYLIKLGQEARSDAVKAVIDLDGDAFRAHLIRNCCGGIIIDPTAKAMQGIDLALLFEQWRNYGVTIDSINFSKGAIKDRKLFRVYIADLGEKNADEIFAKYNHADIQFKNSSVNRYNKGLRHSSFEASDLTLNNANHIDSFRDLFFRGYGDTDVSKNILDLNANFKPWADELYSCNMWTDMELKQLVNPYYTDNILNNLSQSTHQLRNNISAVHDLGTVVNNRYMQTQHILRNSGLIKNFDKVQDIARKRKDIIRQITEQNQHVCRVVLGDDNKFKIIDYTSRLIDKHTSDAFFKSIIDNTIMLDEGMMNTLTDWRKATNIALKMQASNAPEWLGTAYNLYKKTIRSATVTMYLYGNLGTAVRNYVDSSTKGANEVLQYDEDIFTYLKRYKDAVSDVHEYANIYQDIESEFGTVNRETIAKFFEGNTEAMNKFNVLYGYEHICGESLIQDETIKELHRASEQYLMDNLNLDVDVAKRVRKELDKVYGSPKYYAMTRTQIEKHMKEIHDAAMDAVYKNLHKDVVSGQIDLDALSKAFYDYHPTVSSWGDKMAQFPVLGFNRARFNNAETRARLAIYQTFLEGGASEAEAMKHVTATQFHYAGIGKVEDFMPFTQYKLYNALYWFDHANTRAVSTAWRAAQYNGDGAKTNEDIANMIAKYRQASYYIYDVGMDEAYDNYFKNVLEPSIEGIFESGSYLGVPREFGSGNIDANGTHYFKLGNSFVEELDLVTTCMASVAIFTSSMRYNALEGGNTADKLRWAYQSLKFTPLYDSFYSPWKSYIDLVAYTYDHYPMIASHNGHPLPKDHKINSKDVWDCCKYYIGSKDTRSLALSGLPVVGAVLSNMAGRWKSFNLNAGLIAAASIDPDSREELYTNARDMMLDVTGMFIPSLVGTRVEPEETLKYNYYRDTLSKVLISNPGTYIDILGRLQSKEFGFTEDEAKEIKEMMDSLMYTSPHGASIWLGDRSKRGYYDLIVELYGLGYDAEEITNLFRQNSLPQSDLKKFMALSNAFPAYLRYDKEKRAEIIAYYKAMGMSSEEAWARLINHPAVIENGRVREISIGEAAKLNKQQQDAYNATHPSKFTTKEDWDAYWNTMPFAYPKGKWKETREYLQRAGYTFDEACDMLRHGYMLDESGMLVDVPGKVRARVYSRNTMSQAEWDAYWNTIPDYTKYEKGAFGRTMKALKGMGYTDEQARTFIQLGVYANKDGTLMNVTGMERPVLGFPSFNAYYQSLPDYIKYEKGAFKRTYAALKNLGFDYETSLMLIQQGAYLMDMSMAQGLLQTLGARRNKDGSDIAVTDINTLLARYGGQIILSADGTPSMLVNCSGLTRPRRTYSYSSRGRSGSSYGSANNNNNNIYKNIRRWKGRRRRNSYVRSPKLINYKLKKPFILNGNVSTFSGMTNFRGSNKLTKPYTTKGYVSTYSSQDFLNGSSYGMRKTYKIDMRQFKTGALSIKSDYPTSYRNIAVAYRRNMYKDLYAKYGMSRMRMRANKQGYSNAAITRLRRNEIQNRERYDERRDQITKTKTKRKASV